MATRPFFANGGKWEALTLEEKVGCVRFRDRLVGEDWPEECLTAPDAGITVARFVTAYVLSEPMPEEARESSVLRCDRCSAPGAQHCREDGAAPGVRALRLQEGGGRRVCAHGGPRLAGRRRRLGRRVRPLRLCVLRLRTENPESPRRA